MLLNKRTELKSENDAGNRQYTSQCQKRHNFTIVKGHYRKNLHKGEAKTNLHAQQMKYKREDEDGSFTGDISNTPLKLCYAGSAPRIIK